MAYYSELGEKAELVATKMLPGWRLYETAGQTDDADRLVKFARRCGDCTSQIKVVPAESVGLEWWIGGKRMDWSDSYRIGRFVCLRKSETP